MKSSHKVICSVIASLIAFGAFFAYMSTVDIPVLFPSGWVAAEQKHLIVVATILMMIIVLPVFGMMVFFAWKYREGNHQSDYQPEFHHSYLAEFFWWGFPFVIVSILGTMAWTSSHRLNPYRPLEIATDKKPIQIQVVALDWKWLFIYPEYKIATINLMAFPEKTPIQLFITSDAPMNSFWIPDLAGQIYGMSGMETQLHLIADKKGSYRGCSAQINGIGFAGMVFEAKATSDEEFDTWVETAQQSSNILNHKSYQQLLQKSQYDPVKYFSLEDPGLFKQIIMKYTNPKV